MARQRRELSEQLADLVTRQRNTRTISFTTPGMATIGSDMIDPNAINPDHLAPEAIQPGHLSPEVREQFDELERALAGNGTAQDQLAEDMKRLREITLPALDRELASANLNLTSEATRLNALFDEVPSRISAAQAAAITTAAADAESKANAAKAAAITAADTAAKLSAKAAAEAAEARVATAAANDAEAKANAAQAAALAAAKTYADSQASGASGTALAAAKADATEKANAAKAAAIAAAALDATAKKEQAEANAAEAAQDKADKALAAAKTDATTKANAAKAAAEATAALDATTKMNGVANSKNATFYGTVIPTATNPAGSLAGDTYRRRNSAGNIIGEWEWSGSAWTQRKMTSESMTAIDVGILTAGSAIIQDAVAQKLAAATATIQTADIGNLTVTGTTSLASAVAKKIAADTAEFIDLSTDNLVAGKAAIGTGVAERFFTDMFSTRKLTASQVYIGEGGNLFPTDFNDPGWALTSGITVAADGGKTGGSSMIIGSSTAQVGSYFAASAAHRPKAPRVIPGDSYRIKVWVRTNANVPVGGVSIHLRLYPNNTSSSAVTPSPAKIANTKVVIANTWTEIEGQFTVPDGNNNILCPGMYAEATAATAVRFSDLTVSQITTPELIVDGLMNGKRILGASIETSANANRGVKLTNAGLRVYNASGAELLAADESGVDVNGTFTAVAQMGTVKVTPSIPGTGGVPSRTSAGVQLYGPSGDLRGQMYTGYAMTGLYLEGPATTERLSLTDLGVEITGSTVTINGVELKQKAWTLIPLTTGRSALDGNKPAGRIDSTGEFIEFTGGIAMTTSTTTNPAQTFLTLPSGLRPATFKNFVVATSDGPMTMTISAAGAMYLNPTGIGTGGWIDFSQLRFAIAGPR